MILLALLIYLAFMYYAVNCMSGREDNLIRLIKAKINSSLYDDVFTPLRITIRKHSGERRNKVETLFPGYIFVDTNKIKDLSVALLHVPDYARVLGREKETGDFVPLSDEECHALDMLCDKGTNHVMNLSTVSIGVGKTVKVIAGPLMGFQGQIIKVDLHKEVVYVRLQMVGRLVDVKMGITIVQEQF